MHPLRLLDGNGPQTNRRADDCPLLAVVLHLFRSVSLMREGMDGC